MTSSARNSRVGKANESLYANDFPEAWIRRATSASGNPGAVAPALRGTMITVALRVGKDPMREWPGKSFFLQ